MKSLNVFAWLLAGMMVFSLAGCDSKQEKAQKKMLSLMDDYCDILEGIKSNADLVDAKPKFEKIGARMKDLMVEVKDLPKLEPAEEKKLDEKMKKDGEKIATRINNEMVRLKKIGVSEGDLMNSIGMGMGMGMGPMLPN